MNQYLLLSIAINFLLLTSLISYSQLQQNIPIVTKEQNGGFIANVSREVPNFWKSGKGLAITFSCNFEEGGQPISPNSPAMSSGQESVQEEYLVPQNLRNYVTDTWYEYGIHSGVPRLLDLFDSFNIKTSSYIVGQAAINTPQLVKNLVDRGHEPVSHGITWSPTPGMSYEEEFKYHKDGAEAIYNASGIWPKGYNAFWMLNTNNTLDILQKLNFTYYVDDLSKDIPFTKKVNNKDFAVVPYTLRNNDIQFMGVQGQSARQFYETLVMEFDELYRESKQSRRLMSISSHGRYGGTPQMVNAYRKFIEYAGSKEGVWFVRKDWMADWALQNGPNYGCDARDFICKIEPCTGDCSYPKF